MPVELSDLRELLRDTDEVVWQGEELEAAILAAGGESLYRSAGNAVQALAIQYAMSGRSTKTDDLALDTRGRGKDLLEVAKSFFDQANAEDARGSADYFDVVSPYGTSGYVCRVEGSPNPVSCCAGTACLNCVL